MILERHFLSNPPLLDIHFSRPHQNDTTTTSMIWGKQKNHTLNQMEEYPANGEHCDVKKPLSLENPKHLPYTQQHKEVTFPCLGAVDFRRRPPKWWTAHGRGTSQARLCSQGRRTSSWWWIFEMDDGLRACAVDFEGVWQFRGAMERWRTKVLVWNP